MRMPVRAHLEWNARERRTEKRFAANRIKANRWFMLPAQWCIPAYRLPARSRVYQALEAAGGFSNLAAREEINLAVVLADGVHVKFPKGGEKG